MNTSSQKPCRPGRQARRSASIRQWREEIETLTWFLDRIGPEDICCGGLTPRQCAILRVLTSRRGEKLSDLAQATGITPSAMTRVIERLERQGLLTRVHGAMQDGRATTIIVTPRGKRSRGLLEQFMRKRIEAILAAIPVESRPEILEALRRLNEAIKMSGCCGSPCGDKS